MGRIFLSILPYVISLALLRLRLPPVLLLLLRLLSRPYHCRFNAEPQNQLLIMPILLLLLPFPQLLLQVFLRVLLQPMQGARQKLGILQVH